MLDIGRGSGALASHVVRAGARNTFVDARRKPIAFAKRHQGRSGRFVAGDATRPEMVEQVGRESFDAAVYLLRLQDIHPLADTIQVAARPPVPAGGS